jgi:hypothetical protein
MDKNVNFIEQVFKSENVVIVGTGLLFILIAIVVGVFKQTWLIAGVNTMSKEKKATMDLDYVAKYFGLIFGILGGIMFLGVFICTYFGIMNYFHRSMPFLILGSCAFLILFFNVFKRKRIYNKNAGQTKTDLQSKNKSKRNWSTIICIATVVPVGLLIYLAYKEPKAVIDANTFKLKGIYWVNLPFSEIVETDTIVWNKMPAISLRTNGISLNKVHRGKFRTTDGDKVHLSIQRGISPVIKIVDKSGSVYYINRKNADETRQIFKKLEK